MAASRPGALAGASVLVRVRALVAGDWPAVARIYAAGIETGEATFETEVPPWERWDAAHLPGHRFVAVDREIVVGFATLSPYSDRCCYGGVAEDSGYVASEAQGCGIGRVLLERVVDSSEAAGIWTLQGGIFPENAASLALHRRCGFREVGVRERLGRLGGVWRDVVLLERRAA